VGEAIALRTAAHGAGSQQDERFRRICMIRTRELWTHYDELARIASLGAAAAATEQVPPNPKKVN
jgi:hypothetical protein